LRVTAAVYVAKAIIQSSLVNKSMACDAACRQNSLATFLKYHLFIIESYTGYKKEQTYRHKAEIKANLKIIFIYFKYATLYMLLGCLQIV